MQMDCVELSSWFALFVHVVCFVFLYQSVDPIEMLQLAAVDNTFILVEQKY